MYSQNELNNSCFTTIQLVYYLGKSYLQKNFHTLLFAFKMTPCQLLDALMDIYGFDASENFISYEKTL